MNIFFLITTKNQLFSTFYKRKKILDNKYDKMTFAVRSLTMINIIIYEDDENMQLQYQETISSFFKERKQKIKFYWFNHYTKGLEKTINSIPKKKIFILDIDVPGKSGLDLARMIRNLGDWISPLIIITSYQYLQNTSYTSKMLMLDFISKKENIRKRLWETLKIITNIMQPNDSYTFQYNGSLYHIPYRKILYFEKKLNDNYTSLFTVNNSYQLKESIVQIEKKLENHPSFFKTNRSCIVNIHNIEYLEEQKNIIHLGKYTIKLLTKEKKELLKQRLQNTK